MNFLTRLLLWSVLMTLYVTTTRAQEVEALQGVFCGTRGQVERLLVAAETAASGREALELVNSQEPNACHFRAVVATKGQPLATIETAIGFVDIVPLTVTHVFLHIGFVELEEPVQIFAIFASTARGA